ncbi:aldose epimerase family protein [Christiangramia flava]|uniref:Aldose 1-epimerase n=1 Tax=Christiangramia flava JLT2011 TaxID=1229726 RepID=A0A1L7I1J0_9FLAO|nr:aldose epimerase family protein [Christiangramia flava]APU67043.1 Aldose 1-epimerase [Christiangramia flava JLT2011]OSS38716.1 Aldose 1-epimerase [Christiangramia flava JLT2011]
MSKQILEQASKLNNFGHELDHFGITRDGEKVEKLRIFHSNGLEISMINYGGIITSLKTPDRSGKIEDIVLGFDTLSEYEEKSPYFGALIGRFGNRIAKGQFSLDGNSYHLANNNAPNHLHGGNRGFDKVCWNMKIGEQRDDAVSVILEYTSADGEEGYPGELKTKVTYTLTENSLKIEYHATTDAPTVLNLTHHSYFNLSGNPGQPVTDHMVQFPSDYYLPIDEHLIPLGKPEKVTDTPFDFRQPQKIKEGLLQDTEYSQLQRSAGYDHTFVIKGSGEARKFAGTVWHPETGRKLEVFTSEPGMQFYTGNFLEAGMKGKGNATYQKRSGFCLETQHFPDSPNQSQFPSTVLRPGEIFTSETIYQFGILAS